jgi:hypothetical protein
VSFYNTQQEEEPATISATGAWNCSQVNGADHLPNGKIVTVEMTSTVNSSYGTEGFNTDIDYTGFCPASEVPLPQVAASSWSVSIPTDYALTGGSTVYLIQDITQSASETSAGALTITKTLATCSTTVTSATNMSYQGPCS